MPGACASSSATGTARGLFTLTLESYGAAKAVQLEHYDLVSAVPSVVVVEQDGVQVLSAIAVVSDWSCVYSYGPTEQPSASPTTTTFSPLPSPPQIPNTCGNQNPNAPVLDLLSQPHNITVTISAATGNPDFYFAFSFPAGSKLTVTTCSTTTLDTSLSIWGNRMLNRELCADDTCGSQEEVRPLSTYRRLLR